MFEPVISFEARLKILCVSKICDFLFFGSFKISFKVKILDEKERSTS